MGIQPPQESLAQARKNLAPNRPLHFIASVHDRKNIDALCADKRSDQLARGLHQAVRLIGQTCVRLNSPAILPRRAAMEALLTRNSAPTARKYLRLLEEAGTVSTDGDNVRLVFWDALHPKRSDPFWEARAEHQRSVSARSSAKHRCKTSPAEGKLFSQRSPQVTEITRTKPDVTPLYLNPSCARTKTKTQARALTHAAMALPELPKPVPSARPVVVRTSAPQKPSNHTQDEIDAVDRELLGELAPVDKPQAEPIAPVPGENEFQRRVRERINRGEVWSGEEKTQDDKRPVQQGTPAKAAPVKASPASREAPVTVPQLIALHETHERLLGDHAINFVALANIRAPYGVARTAFDIAAERLRSSTPDGRAPVKDPGAFIHGTMRRLARSG